MRGLALATINLYLPNVKSLTPPSINIRKAIQNVENGVVWAFGVVRGHSRSLEIAPFDKVLTSSY